MINILIRTSGRPVMFAKCIASIARQDLVAQHFVPFLTPRIQIRVIVSTDDAASFNYATAYKRMYKSKLNIDVIKVTKRERTEEETAPWNLYLNDLMAKVKEGWIFILDDDDELAHEDAITDLCSHARDHEQLILCRMVWPTGRLIPEDEYFGKVPERKHIGMPCFMFHSKHKKDYQFDGMRAGDYRMALKLFYNIKHHVLIKKPVVNVGNTGLNGGKGK